MLGTQFVMDWFASSQKNPTTFHLYIVLFELYFYGLERLTLWLTESSDDKAKLMCQKYFECDIGIIFTKIIGPFGIYQQDLLRTNVICRGISLLFIVG